MAGMGGGATGGADAGGFEGFDFSQFTGGGFSDFFTQMFGGGGGRARSYRSGFKRGFDPFGNESGTVSYADRECTVNIDMYTALLGGSIIVQTPEGDKLKLKIKPGTQPGAKVRLKGKGDMHSDGTRGNLILTYNVQLPASLSERQKELLQQMRMG